VADLDPALLFEPTAMTKVVAVLVLVVGCYVGNDSTGATGVKAAANCEGAGTAQAACIEEVTQNKVECYEGCLSEGIKCGIDIVIDQFTNAFPCAGPVLSSLLTQCTFCAKEDADEIPECLAKCGKGLLDTYFKDFDTFKRTFSACAASASLLDIWNSVKDQVAKNLTNGLVDAGICIGKYMACAHLSIGEVAGSCDTQFQSQQDACEIARCNPDYCTCFDAPECPTIAGGAAGTHMTGVALCNTISGGLATDAAGDQIACSSYRNQADIERCVETGYNADGSFGNRGRFEACDNDSHCSSEFQCMDYDCDGEYHCDYAGLGGDGNCCDHPGPRDVGCKDKYDCIYDEEVGARVCVPEEGPDSGG
jgi:hypothetical protein